MLHGVKRSAAERGVRKRYCSVADTVSLQKIIGEFLLQKGDCVNYCGVRRRMAAFAAAYAVLSQLKCCIGVSAVPEI